MGCLFSLFVFIPAVVAVLRNKKVPVSDVSHELSGSTKDEATAFPERTSQKLPEMDGNDLSQYRTWGEKALKENKALGQAGAEGCEEAKFPLPK